VNWKINDEMGGIMSLNSGLRLWTMLGSVVSIKMASIRNHNKKIRQCRQMRARK